MELGPGGVAGRAAEAPCWQAGGMAAKLTSLAEKPSVLSPQGRSPADLPSDSNSENRKLKSKEFTLGKTIHVCVSIREINENLKADK